LPVPFRQMGRSALFDLEERYEKAAAVIGNRGVVKDLDFKRQDFQFALYQGQNIAAII